MSETELRTIIADIQASARESEWVEIKKDNDDPELIGEYISALANGAACMGQSKGYLVFGIDDSTHELIGTSFRPREKKVGNEEIENWIAIKLNPRIDFIIEEITIQEKRIVLFIIDAAGNTPVKFRGRAWIRVGSYKKPLSDYPERERKIWQNTHHQTFENRIAKAGVSADEVLSMIDYPSAFRLLSSPLPENKSSVLEKLAQEKIIQPRASCYDITNLGAILFALDLRSFELLARKAIRVVFYKGDDRIDTLKEHVCYKGYATGFAELATYIGSHLSNNEEIGAVLRKETPTFPPIAMREFVANALIHQDFSISGTSPMIEIFKNRMEITNPGRPLIDTLRFIDHTPMSRNESLASLMRRMGFCEERGSGIDRALAQCELYQLPAPEFSEGELYTKVVMFAPKTMRQMNKGDKIRACYQHCCLRYVAGGKMTNQSLRNRFQIDPANYSIASRIITDTLAAHLIKLDDSNRSRKFAQYVPVWA